MARFDFFVWSKSDYDALMGALSQIIVQQQQIMQSLNRASQTGAKIMTAMDDLKAQVTANTNLADSAKRLIEGIAKQLEEAIANHDDTAIAEITQQLKSGASGLADAVAANTQVNPLKK